MAGEHETTKGPEWNHLVLILPNISNSDVILCLILFAFFTEEPEPESKTVLEPRAAELLQSSQRRKLLTVWTVFPVSVWVCWFPPMESSPDDE